ncbi:glyoxal reductase-like [Tiliqua scincoides]|uniref:glyoxal reductase-like n=1 Tax=Tiliqua scincoides TaxID=71010 RepID=UPI0034632AB1
MQQTEAKLLPRSWVPEQTAWLNTDSPMPLLGLGTFRLQDEEVVRLTLEAALQNGYHLVDTAAVYGSEATLGRALGEMLPRHSLERSDVFLTSKLGPRDQGEEAAEKACLQSLQELDCEYLDCYLIHWPGTQGRPQEDRGNRERREQSWRALERLHEAGKLRAIGVSNYTVQHLRELLASSKNSRVSEMASHSKVEMLKGSWDDVDDDAFQTSEENRSSFSGQQAKEGGVPSNVWSMGQRISHWRLAHSHGYHIDSFTQDVVMAPEGLEQGSPNPARGQVRRAASLPPAHSQPLVP